jgi:hypothetical protein
MSDVKACLSARIIGVRLTGRRTAHLAGEAVSVEHLGACFL